MKTRIAALSMFLCLAASWIAGCSAFPISAQAAPAATPASPILPAADRSVAEGRLKPVQTLDLAFPSGGRVAEVLIEEGDKVAPGQLLARLEGAEWYQAQISAAKLEIVQSEQGLQELTDHALVALAQASAELEAARKELDAASGAWNGTSVDKPSAFDTALKDYVDADKAVKDARTALDKESGQAVDAPTRVQAQSRLDREMARRAKAFEVVRASFEDPKETAKDTTRTALVKAIARMETAQLRLDKLAGGPDPDLTAQFQARLEGARAAQAAAQKSLDDLELHAPWGGAVYNWDLKANQVLSAGQPVGSLADLSGWVVETTDLVEDEVVGLKVGDPVAITVNALPGETYTGRVQSIHGKGEKIQGDMTYVMHIAMEQSDPNWYWNMTVKVITALD